jgi:hypothetical protein
MPCNPDDFLLLHWLQGGGSVITIKKHGGSRHWEVLIGGKLLVICVYRRGADQLAKALSAAMNFKYTP